MKTLKELNALLLFVAGVFFGHIVDAQQAGGLLPIPKTVFCTTTCSAAGIKIGQTYYIQKPSNTTRASTVTITNDPDLIFTNVPVGNYEIAWGLQANSANAANTQGIQVAMVCSGTCTNTPSLGYQCFSNQTSALCGFSGGYNWPQSPALVWSSAVSGELIMQQYPGQLFVNVSGSLGIGWAQAVSSATGTIVRQFSWIKITRNT